MVDFVGFAWEPLKGRGALLISLKLVLPKDLKLFLESDSRAPRARRYHPSVRSEPSALLHASITSD